MHAAILIHRSRLHRLSLFPAGVVKRCGRVVGANDSERAVRDAAPNLLEVSAIMAQRRRANVFGALDVALAGPQALAHEVEIVRTRLGVDGEQPRLGVGDVLDCARRRHVHEQDGRVGHLGERDGAVGCLGLGDLRPRDGVEEGAGVAGLGEALCDGGDHVAVLGVYHGRDTQTPRSHHDVEQVCIAELHRLVRHVQFHGRDALVLHELRQFLFEDGLGGVGENYVEAVVAVGVASGLCMVGLESWVDGVLMALLACKGDYGRVPASHRTAAAGGPSISGRRVVLLDVYV